MTPRRLIPTLVLVLAAAVPTAAGAKSTPAPCAKHGSTTLASSSTARVYGVDTSDSEFTKNAVYGCLRSNGRRTRIVEEYDDSYVLSGEIDALKLGGRYVVYLFSSTDISCKAACPPGYEPTTHTLAFVDLKNRKHGRLDTGDIDPKSLTITGSTASWTNGGAPKTASLS
jgi:hypothetical protein